MSNFTQRVKGLLTGGLGKANPNTEYGLLDVVEEENPAYKLFNSISKNREEILKKHSVSSVNNSDSVIDSYLKRTSPYHVFMYSGLPDEKAARLQEYRTIAGAPAVSNALDEYCDEFIALDDNDEFCNLTLKDLDDMPEGRQKELIKHFKRILSYFNLEEDGWMNCRHLLVDAELYYEHIINKKNPGMGILGMTKIPTQLIDPIYSNSLNEDIASYMIRKPVYEETDPSKIKEYKLIPLDENQVTYIHSNVWNDRRSFRIPFLENCREAYRRLSLVEDAVIIFRLVRAPEKLVFNIDTGQMPLPEQEAMIRRMQQDYWSRKTFDGQNGGATQKFNPQSMLDSYWFPKRSGSDGSSVTKLSGGENLSQLPDLDYFKKKLYESLKVPSSRLSKESQAAASDATIQREELAFARSVIRVQRQFATAIKQAYITHLKLIGIFGEYKLKETNFKVEFVEPSNYMAMRQQQLLNVKAANYKTMIETQTISQTYAMKKYLHMSDSDIKANRALQRLDAAFLWELEQIKSQGPNWREFLKGKDAAPGGEGGGPDMGGMGGGPPPDMGGGGPPPDMGPDAGGPPPEGGDEGGPPPDAGGGEAGSPPPETPPAG